ncbi:MAG: histidine phosphatase family protein [Candidatus Paceibacterota bacterium]
MKIIAVRHGETIHNKKRRVMGSRIDSPLTEEGRREAEEQVERIRKEEPTALYSSPLTRALQTAEILSKALDLPITIRDGLKERDVGSLSGATYTEMAKKAGLKNPEEIPYDFTPFGGESSEEVAQRVTKFLNYVHEKHSADPAILVITHAHIIRMLYQIYKQEATDVSNVCVHPFEV